MKELKDNGTNLCPAMAEMCKIRGNGQDLQLEGFKCYNRKNFFMRGIAEHWNELILEMMTTFDGFSSLARKKSLLKYVENPCSEVVEVDGTLGSS